MADVRSPGDAHAAQRPPPRSDARPPVYLGDPGQDLRLAEGAEGAAVPRRLIPFWWYLTGLFVVLLLLWLL